MLRTPMPGERPATITNDIVFAVEGYVNGRFTRREFMKRAAAAGMAMPAIAAVLNAAPVLAQDAQPTTPPEVGSDALSVVYPLGTASISDFVGPAGPSSAAVLPSDYYTLRDDGTWDWRFSDFTADRPLRMAFAHFSAQWDLSVELAARAAQVGAEFGVEVDAFDNNFDANQAITNADLIAQGGYDFAYFAQIFPDANKAIYNKLKAANIESAYLAVEASGEPEARFMDMGNLRQHTALGRWLGEYARDNWGGQVDLVILGAQPRAGAYVAQREVGYINGIREVLPELPDSVFQTVDTQGLLTEAQKLTADLLTANPGANHILGCGTNDDTGVGITRAIEAAGRGATAACAGQAGQASAMAELLLPDSIFKVSSFIEVESWLWALAIGAIAATQGVGATAPNNLIPYYITTKENIAQFPPQIVYSKA